MGLFDSYFDPEQFQDSGGLLGRLLSLQQQQGQFQSGPGFVAQADSASAPTQPAAIPMPMPQPQMRDERPRQTVAIGDYQMPQFGSADPSQAAQQPGIGDRLSAGFQSWAHTPLGNPFAALANGVSGFSSGQRSDPAAVVQQILKSQIDATGNPRSDLHARYQTLRSLLGDENAMLAIVHPEVGSSLIAQALTVPAKPGNIGEADLTGKDQAGPGTETSLSAIAPSGPASTVFAGDPQGSAVRRARRGPTDVTAEHALRARSIAADLRKRRV